MKHFKYLHRRTMVAQSGISFVQYVQTAITSNPVVEARSADRPVPLGSGPVSVVSVPSDRKCIVI